MCTINMFLKALILLLATRCVMSRYFIVGPAQLKVLSTKVCPNYGNLPMKSEITPYMYNKSQQVYDGYFYVPVELNENVTVSLKASRIDTQKTQTNSFVINDAVACPTLTKYLGDFWFDLQRQIGMEPAVCPIKPGNYSVQHLMIDLSKIKVQMLLEGHFKTRVMFKQFNKPIYCSDFELTLAPKLKQSS